MRQPRQLYLQPLRPVEVLPDSAPDPLVPKSLLAGIGGTSPTAVGVVRLRRYPCRSLDRPTPTQLRHRRPPAAQHGEGLPLLTTVGVRADLFERDTA